MDVRHTRDLLFQSCAVKYGALLEEIKGQINAAAKDCKYQISLEYLHTTNKDVLEALVQFFVLQGYNAAVVEHKAKTVKLIIDWDARGYKSLEDSLKRGPQ